jgi:uncharacterized protein with FMN-binding domain
VRASTKSAIGAITLGVIGLSYNIGETAVVASHSFSAPPMAPPAQPSATAEVSVQPEPGASTAPSQSASAGSKPSTSTAPVTPAKPSATASTVPAPVVNPPAATAITVAGSAVQSGFGIVQVQVTKTGSKITDVTMLQANATKGRSGAFSYLVQYAIDANGANFANISGATYTTDAFKQSLSAALAKF